MARPASPRGGSFSRGSSAASVSMRRAASDGVDAGSPAPARRSSTGPGGNATPMRATHGLASPRAQPTGAERAQSAAAAAPASAAPGLGGSSQGRSGAPSPSAPVGGKQGEQASAAQLAKQVAEKERREQAGKQREELEMLRSQTTALVAENARLTEEVGIWKNAQTAASALQADMDKLRASHGRLKAELATQVTENGKLKREKVEIRDEIKRMKALVANAEKARAAPSLAPLAPPSLISEDNAGLGDGVATAQQQLLAALLVQGRYKRRKQARLSGKQTTSQMKLVAMAASRSGTIGTTKPAAEIKDKPPKANEVCHKSDDTANENGTSEGSIPSLKGQGGAKELACAKFEASIATFTLGFKGLEAYYGGLEAYVGTPSPDIANAIEREHGSEKVFSSHNVVNTTPRREWLYVAVMEVGTLPDRKQDATSLRTGWQLNDFFEHDRSRAAKLLREEVLSARLYTGPMYVIYNNRILRMGIKGEYVTTLHTINSAVLKLSKLQQMATVYRGVSGGVLPDSFFTPDENGSVGGVEAGFMSTTTERAVALEFAQRRTAGGRVRPSMLFHIKMGMVDKGASVEFLSQFPHEKEILMPPLTGLEVVAKPWIEGTTVVIDLRLNCNRSDLTIEQVIGKMKRSHLDLIDLMHEDLHHSGAPRRALLSLTGLRQESEARDAAEFNLAKNYRAATERALAAQKDVMDALGEKSSWDSESGTGKEVAASMMKVVTLQARAGEFDFATQLLLQAIERNPLPVALEQKMDAADKSLTGRGAQHTEQLSDADRKLFAAAVLLVHRGATPPWPPMIVSLLNAMSQRGQRAFGAVLPMIDPERTRPTFPPGTPIIVWSIDQHRWEEGVVKTARGRGMYEVQTRGIETIEVPMKFVMRQSEGGLGAMLYETARRGSLPLLDALLRGGLSPFECDMKGNTALHFAVRRGHAAMCKLLVAAGADAEVPNQLGTSAWDLALQCGHAGVRRIFSPSAADRDLQKPITEGKAGATPLLIASQTGDLAAVTELLGSSDTRARIDEVWRSGGTTALMLASRSGEVEIVKRLLKASASAEQRSRRGASALSMAAEEGHTNVVTLLLAAGAEVDQEDDDGYTALGVACENGHTDSVRELLMAKSDPNLHRKNGWTCLITAAYNGYVPVVRALADGGADPNLAKDNGYNAAIAAAYNGFDDVVSALLDAKADANIPMKNGWSALMVASAQGHPSTVATLCEAGALIDYCRPVNGFNALMAAAATSNDSTCANVLLQHGASIALQDKQGSDALMHAAWHGHISAVAILLQANANPTTRRLGGTSALMDAAAGGHEAVVAKLVAACKGSEVGGQVGIDLTDSHGMTALMHAAQAGHDMAMVPLLQANCALNVKNSLGYSALAIASTTEVVTRLLAAGADERGRKGLPMPEPRVRTRESAPAALVEEMRRSGATAEGTDGGRSGGGRGTGDASDDARGRGGRSSVAEEEGGPSGKGGAPPKSKAASPWSLGVDATQQKKGSGIKADFLKVRPRKDDAVTKGSASARGMDSARRGPAKPAAVVKLFEKHKEVDPVEERRHAAAVKLQKLFKARIASKLRAETQLFSMFNQCKQGLSNHWEEE